MTNIQRAKYHSFSPVGLVSCACMNSHASWGWRSSGWTLLSTVSFVTLAIFLPYITAMARRAMPAILPFISQAGGSPPQTGIFAICLIALCITGLLAFVMIYENINHRNTQNVRKIRWLNVCSLVTGSITGLGCILTAAYPIGFTEVPNKFEWVVTVLFEHGIGATMVLFGVVIHQFFLTRISWLLPDVSRKTKYLRTGFCIVYVILFLISIKPLPTHLMEELGPEPFNVEMLKSSSYDLPLKFTTSYLISAFCEWLVCIICTIFLLMMYKDLERVSCHVVIRHKSCLEEASDPVTSIALKMIS